jgi:hypothetical protein
VHDHIKIAHHSLLVPPPASAGQGQGQFAGAYWTGTEMLVVNDLGPDQDEALDDFRALLQDLGET